VKLALVLLPLEMRAVPTPSLPDAAERRKRIAQAGSLQALLDQPDGRQLLEEEAADPDNTKKLITKDQLNYLLAIHEERKRPGARFGLFFSTDDVIIVPGFLGSSLTDETGGNGLIWVDPGLVLPGRGKKLSALKLAAFDKTKPDHDSTSGVTVEARGTIPAVYDLLRADLEFRRYSVQIFPFDWRKDIERSADLLADLIRGRLGRKPRPLHVIAHSQGTLVARRAIQNMGADQARRLVNNLVLLGPATFGTFSAAFAIAGDHESIGTVQRLGVHVPADFAQVLQSFTGLYQLLPWGKEHFPNGFDPLDMSKPKFWETKADANRLKAEFGWGRIIDTAFFNDRTTIVLGDSPTVGAVKFTGGKLVADGAMVQGDGTVPDFLAKLPGVRTYRAQGAEHSVLPMQLSVMAAVRAILRGDAPAIDSSVQAAVAGVAAQDKNHKADEPPVLKDPGPPTPKRATAARRAPTKVGHVAHGNGSPSRVEPPAPPCRRLRVFSFDPLLATNLDTLEIAEITIEVPWEPEGQLNEGPIGEYVEVIDYDPASQCFYAPVDLSLPRLTTQDGLTASESNPQFHQQMCYAVSMATIRTFEQALGRVALWAPYLKRDEDGEAIPGQTAETTYVPRLRIYPHALREANAFYDPGKHALLFGYFPSRGQPGGETLPGGTVFACQSFDIVAHETTHALLHGLHRFYFYPSNPDLLAFHEAFADAVALFQHFSQKDVVRSQIARTRGDLKQENLLGQLAQQFGAAMGDHRGALRRYVDTQPDPTKYLTSDEPHDRGAILMAALFRAFQNIYAHRSKDLYRIATGGTGKLPEGDIHPDLVNRLAGEAAKSARHVLNMCVRALDYVPPVDLTFGEYLRALITADFDLVRDDDLGYRVAVIDAFRSWGIYPPGVNVLDEAALLWTPPAWYERNVLRGILGELHFTDWTLRADRRTIFAQMEKGATVLRKWLYADARETRDEVTRLGLMVLGSKHHSIPRNKWGRPKFDVHSIRPCSRIGPDGQQRVDLVAEVVQRRAGYLDEAVQDKVDSATTPWLFSKHDEDPAKPRTRAPKPDFWFRSGCSLIIDGETGEIRYCVGKGVLDDTRLKRQRAFEKTGALPSAAATYFGTQDRNPFALLHNECQ
jgi:hypothetical protein